MVRYQFDFYKDPIALKIRNILVQGDSVFIGNIFESKKEHQCPIRHFKHVPLCLFPTAPGTYSRTVVFEFYLYLTPKSQQMGAAICNVSINVSLQLTSRLYLNGKESTLHKLMETAHT